MERESVAEAEGVGVRDGRRLAVIHRIELLLLRAVGDSVFEAVVAVRVAVRSRVSEAVCVSAE